MPAGVWTLGFVSMLMDISSEMIHGLLPIYMVSMLGASTLAVGAIEGIAEATAAITKIFSGALSESPFPTASAVRHLVNGSFAAQSLNLKLVNGSAADLFPVQFTLH